jgi:hypothetical protein
MLARYTAVITIVIVAFLYSRYHAYQCCCIAVMYISTFKYVSVKITRALVPTPVSDLLCDICGDIKRKRFGWKIDK